MRTKRPSRRPASASTLEVICYVIVWAAQLLIIQRGMETVRKFQDWAGPAVWVVSSFSRARRPCCPIHTRPEFRQKLLDQVGQAGLADNVHPVA